MSSQADCAALVRQIRANPGDGVAANALLAALGRGESMTWLQQLVNDSDPRVVAEGAWVAAELGGKARALMPEMTHRLEHEAFRVRYWAAEYAFRVADDHDAGGIARALELASDPSGAVRKKLASLLARAQSEKLTAALAEGAGEVGAEGLGLLVDEPPDMARIRGWIESGCEARRLIGAAAAARWYRCDDGGLAVASASTDDDVREFALRWKERSERPGEALARRRQGRR